MVIQRTDLILLLFSLSKHDIIVYWPNPMVHEQLYGEKKIV